MKEILRPFGIVAFWLSWPALIVYLRLAERARVVIVVDEKVLLVNNWYGDGSWSLPGGGKHRSEEPARAAARELQEEVGLNLDAEQLRFARKSIYHHKGFRYTCHYFVADAAKLQRLRPSFPEVLDAEWVSIRNLSRRRLAPDVMDALSARSALLQ